MLSLFLLDALRCGLAVGQKVDQPLPESQDVAILFFFIHCLWGYFRELKKSLMAPFLENHMFVIIIFAEINIQWASLINDSLDMLAINIADIRGYPSMIASGFLDSPTYSPFRYRTTIPVLRP